MPSGHRMNQCRAERIRSPEGRSLSLTRLENLSSIHFNDINFQAWISTPFIHPPLSFLPGLLPHPSQHLHPLPHKTC